MPATKWTKWTVAGALGLVAAGAHASLVLMTNESFSTLGANNVMATLHAEGGETGGVRLLSNGTPAPAPSNTIQPWQVLTIAQLGLASAADFRLIVAPQETDDLLSVTTLGVQFFAPSGTILYTTTTNQRHALTPSTMVGQGFVFALDAEQAAEAQAAAFGSPDNVVGVFGNFSGSTGGPETLMAAARTSPPPPIPEPSTYALMAGGLAALGLVVRRRRAGR